MSEPVRYRVDIVDPARHVVRIKVDLPHLSGGQYLLRIPVWSPGSYLVREYARHLSALVCHDGRGRRILLPDDESLIAYVGGALVLGLRAAVYWRPEIEHDPDPKGRVSAKWHRFSGPDHAQGWWLCGWAFFIASSCAGVAVP